MASKYVDGQGKYRTCSLFYEMKNRALKIDYQAPFTLREHDHTDIHGREYVSMRQLYLSIADPTEYEFAEQVLGSWDQWQRLVNANWFKPYVEVWRNELEIKLRSQGIAHMIDIAASGQAGSSAASKFLAKGEWRDLRGRPSKQELEGRAKNDQILHEETVEEAKRLGIDLPPTTH